MGGTVMKLRTLAVVGLTIATGYAGWIGVSRSGLVAVDSVEVTGAKQIEASLIREASGIEPGQNALSLDLGAAEARVEELPLIADATVSRRGALGVVIAVVERTAAIRVVVGPRTEFYDRDGHLVGPPDEPRPMPVLEAREFETADVEAALAAWSALTFADRSRASFSVAKQRGLIMHQDDLIVVLADASAMKTKMETLATLKERLKGQGDLKRVDLTDPTRPTVRLK
jgi:cell division septal protein FtsQ